MHSHKKRRVLKRLLNWTGPESSEDQNSSMQFARSSQEALDAADNRGEGPGRLTLANLKPGQCADIAVLIGTSQSRLRLLEMGLTPGVHVRVVRVAAFGGPLDIEVRGYQLSLRREEAASVLLSYVGDHV